MHRLEPWTQSEVVGRIREAGDTVKRLPRPKGPAGYGSGWPPIVRSVAEAYGYTPGSIKPAAPTPRAIDRMDEVFSWFKHLDGRADEMRALWFAVGYGISFSNTGRMLGVSRTTVRMRVWAGVTLIVEGLNEAGKKST